MTGTEIDSLSWNLTQRFTPCLKSDKDIYSLLWNLAHRLTHCHGTWHRDSHIFTKPVLKIQSLSSWNRSQKMTPHHEWQYKDLLLVLKLGTEIHSLHETWHRDSLLVVKLRTGTHSSLWNLGQRFTPRRETRDRDSFLVTKSCTEIVQYSFIVTNLAQEMTPHHEWPGKDSLLVLKLGTEIHSSSWNLGQSFIPRHETLHRDSIHSSSWT